MPTRSSPAMLSWACWTRLWEFPWRLPFAFSIHFTSFAIFAMPLVVVTSFVLSWRWRDVPTPSCTISVEVVDINKDMKADLVHHFLRFCQFCHSNAYMKPQKRTALSHHLISRIVIQKRHWRSRRRMPSWHMRRAPRHV